MPAEHPLTLARVLRASLVLVLTLGLATPALVLLDRREASAATADQVLTEAAKHVGKAYRYGATGPANFDCSGYTSYVFRQVGIELPRTSGAQRAALPSIPNDQKQPGDLIFTHDSRGRVYHVGIYAGDGMIWHSPRSGDVVKHSRIFGTYTVGRTPLAAPAPPAPPPPATPIAAHYAQPHIRAALGAPTSPEFAVAGGVVQNFRGGQILQSADTGVKSVQGSIHKRYAAERWEQGPLGFPTSDEFDVQGAKVSTFQGGEIVWTPTSGARVIRGEVRAAYLRNGGLQALGVPVAEEVPVRGGSAQRFGRATVFLDGDSRRATALTGEVLEAYSAAGGPDGELGMPVAVEHGGARVQFEGGAIAYDSSRKVAALVG